VERFDPLARSHSTRQLEARREHSRAQQHDGNLPATRQQPIQRNDDPGFVIQRRNPSWLGRRLVSLRHAGKLEERHALMLDKSGRTGLKRPGAPDSPDHNRIRVRACASEWTVAPVAHRMEDQKDVADRASVTNPLLRLSEVQVVASYERASV
jgi:hypothetical protein